MNELMKHRGRFTLTRYFIEDIPAEVLFLVFKDMVILRTTEDLWGDRLEYLAVSPKFDFVPECERAPEYKAELQIVDDDYVPVWRRVE